MSSRSVPSLERIDTPEGLLVMHPESPAGIPLDAITSCIERAGAVLSMLSGYFDGTVSPSAVPSNDVLANAVWSVEGDLALIRTLVDHAWDTESEVAPKNP